MQVRGSSLAVLEAVAHHYLLRRPLSKDPGSTSCADERVGRSVTPVTGVRGER